MKTRKLSWLAKLGTFILILGAIPFTCIFWLPLGLEIEPGDTEVYQLFYWPFVISLSLTGLGLSIILLFWLINLPRPAKESPPYTGPTQLEQQQQILTSLEFIKKERKKKSNH